MQIRIVKEYILITAISLYMFTIVHNNKQSGHRGLNGMNIATSLNYTYTS